MDDPVVKVESLVSIPRGQRGLIGLVLVAVIGKPRAGDGEGFFGHGCLPGACIDHMLFGWLDALGIAFLCSLNLPLERFKGEVSGGTKGKGECAAVDGRVLGQGALPARRSSYLRVPRSLAQIHTRSDGWVHGSSRPPYGHRV